MKHIYVENIVQDWDYIIVGGGSTGCVLANRLSANPQRKVLLLEAGSSNQSWQFAVPTGNKFTVDNPNFDWCYVTEPDPTRHNRTEKWNAGKGLGGGSAINGMIYLHGEASDFDEWEKLGNKGWGYKDVLPYFRKAENFFLGESEYHGVGGPVSISPVEHKHFLSQQFIEAAKAIGIPENDDFNKGTEFGVGFYHTNQERGRRCSTAHAYLTPIRRRKNLKIITQAIATKLLIQNKKVIGVEYLKNNTVHQVYCNQEVIVSAGAIATPKLLMLSGIGDSNYLTQMGIPVLHHLPGVGKNLQEHPAAIMNFETKIPTLYQELSGYKKYLNALRWLLFRSGPMTSPICQAAACVNVTPDSKIPEIQIGFTPVGFVSAPSGLSYGQNPIVSIYTMVMRAESRGHIELASKNPLDHPKIYYPYFEKKSDLDLLVTSCKIARQIFNAKPLADYIVKEQMPGEHINTDAELEEYIRNYSARCFHVAGTCKMGHDELAVVNDKLQVHGLAGIRIADASIMPLLVSSNTTAPCIMIGEKTADLILQSYD